MNAVVNFPRNTAKQWTKRSPGAVVLGICRSPVNLVAICSLFILYLLFVLYSARTAPSNPRFQRFRYSTLCALDSEEKFLWYAPHSGFSNQLSEFKNGLLIAGILNRTLVVPPVLDHHAVVLGSCPKFRVAEPRDIRRSVWEHSLDLLQDERYISVSNIVDISSVVPRLVRVIDFRDFASQWCNVNLDMVCKEDFSSGSALLTTLKQCGNAASGIDDNAGNCLYPVDNDCRTTVWTYNDGKDGMEDSFQPDELLKKKKKIPYIRLRRDIFKTLGPGTIASSFKVLAFGSLFSSPYKGSQLLIDIPETIRDAKIQNVQKKVKYLPFLPEINEAGKAFVTQRVKVPFFCAQLRLLDGQFKNHWKSTFSELKRRLEGINSLHPIHIFVMTDLPRGNWTGTYLGDLDDDYKHWKLHSLRDDEELVVKAAKDVSALRDKNHCDHSKLPEILLFIEETVCSCATLGFVGTVGSTIAESIELMRKHNACEFAKGADL